MTRFFLLLILILSGQQVTASTVFYEDFETYSGTGLQPGGTQGSLDSRLWRIDGLAGGNSHFGDQLDSGSVARGSSTGNVRSGGLYAFDIAGNHSLGWQSTAAELTPGSLFLQVLNSGPSVWHDITLDFDLWLRNDQPRSSQVTLYANTPGNLSLPLLEFKTPLAAGLDPVWQRHNLQVSMGDLLVIPSAFLTLQWLLTDAGGHGSRDELSIDNLRLTSVEPAIRVGDGIATVLYCSFGLGLAVCFGTRPTRHNTLFNNA